jgi:hypothetical protein
MGRLRKAKIDEIIRLRNDGYTQQETAERARVNLKTVRKYDPLKQPKHVAPPLEERVRCLEALVHYLTGIAIVTGDYPPTCPHCLNQDLLWADAKELEALGAFPYIHTWACPKCGFFVDTYGRIDPESIKFVDLETDKPLRSPHKRSRRVPRSTGRKKR